MRLTKSEIETLRHALYLYRETVRVQNKLAMNRITETSKRDVDRFDKILRHAMRLDDKLSDMLNNGGQP